MRGKLKRKRKTLSMKRRSQSVESRRGKIPKGPGVKGSPLAVGNKVKATFKPTS